MIYPIIFALSITTIIFPIILAITGIYPDERTQWQLKSL